MLEDAGIFASMGLVKKAAARMKLERRSGVERNRRFH
jgi:hypothetical protein